MPQARTILEHPTVQRARLRAKCERAVDRLLAVLDAIDGDADLEPSLGSSEPGSPYSFSGLDQRHIAEGATDDREGPDDDLEPSEDPEDTLGRSENLDQRRVEFGQDDKEPSLGASAAVDQRQWGERHQGFAYDGEDQCEDEGGQCEDEGDISADLPAPDHHPADQRLVAMGAFAGVTRYHDVDGRTPKPANEGG